MRYCLIATDIDGTLLNEERVVSQRTRQAITDLRARGVMVVLSTSRPLPTVLPLYQELGLDSLVITSNGAVLFDPAAGKLLAHRAIGTTTALRLLRAVRAIDPAMTVFVELADRWLADRVDSRIEGLYRKGSLPALPDATDIEAVIAGSEGVSKVYFVGPLGAREQLTAALQADGVLGELAITTSGGGFVEVTATGVDKGSALRAVAVIVGIPMAASVALGDGENDIPALRVAGLGIAMGNAPDVVKRAAGAVSPSNAAEGWAAAVEEHVLAALA